MKYFLIFGAGKSSLFLIEHLHAYGKSKQIKTVVCDKDIDFVRTIFNLDDFFEFKQLDIFKSEDLEPLIKNSEIVVSLLPAHLHLHIAKYCLNHNKNLCTASYISDEMQQLNEQAKQKGLIFLNEMGLDPGIDHMSAIQLFDDIKYKGGEIQSFKSYCGGLVDDDCEGDNPWRYKFTWNPRNVVLAGQGGCAQFLSNHQLKILPYHQLFKKQDVFNIDGQILEGYPNRDSLIYTKAYGLEKTSTIIRGTLRKQGFCSAWQQLVSLGLTDNHKILQLDSKTTCRQWINMYCPMGVESIQEYLSCNDEDMAKIKWLGLLDDSLLPIFKGTSAEILEEILKTKWQLMPNDKDMVVMIHEITYQLNNKLYELKSFLKLKGETQTRTAMAKTVGLPLAYGTILLYEGKIKTKGVIMPIFKEIYQPVLEQLKHQGIDFQEVVNELT
jgi:saccharopine dehydrogenase-like NADP-dependent oxidoreductase